MSHSIYIIIIMIQVYFLKFLICEESLKFKVNLVRSKVIHKCREERDLCHPTDIEIYKTKDYIIERYLKDSSMDVKAACLRIIKTLKFYKTEKLHELTDEYFPAEFFATGFLINHGRSKYDEPVSGVCIRCLFPFNDISEEMYELGRKFLLYYLFKQRMEAYSGRRVFYATFDRIEYTNIDVRFLYNIIDFVNNYVPQQPSTYLVMDLGWAFKLSVQILINLLSSSVRSQIIFTSMSEIDQWVDTDQIPRHAGGTLENFQRIPDGVKSGKLLTHLNYIPKRQWNAFRKFNINCIIEGMVEMNSTNIEDYLKEN